MVYLHSEITKETFNGKLIIEMLIVNDQTTICFISDIKCDCYCVNLIFSI